MKSDLKELIISMKNFLKNAAKTFQNVDQAMQEYSLLTGNVLPPLSAQPQLEDVLDDE